MQKPIIRQVLKIKFKIILILIIIIINSNKSKKINNNKIKSIIKKIAIISFLMAKVL